MRSHAYLPKSEYTERGVAGGRRGRQNSRGGQIGGKINILKKNSALRRFKLLKKKYEKIIIFGAFAKLRKVTISFVMHVGHGTTRLPLNGFS